MTLARLKAPFPYFGGKSRAAPLIWKHLGDTPNYVEPFAGSIAYLLGRPLSDGGRCALETVNDMDGYVVNAWRALQGDPEGVAKWADYPVMELDLHARHRWLVHSGKKRVERLRTDPDYYDVKVAGWWIWGIALWIGSGWCVKPEWKRVGGRAQTKGVHSRVNNYTYNQFRTCTPMGIHAKSGGHSRRSENPADQRKRPNLGSLKGVIQKLPKLMAPGAVHQIPKLMAPGAVHQIPKLTRGGRGVIAKRREWLLEWFHALADRLRNVRVCCGDWKRVLTPAVTWKIGGGMLTGVLLDPPYAASTGRDADLYSHDSGTIAHDVRSWAVANGGNRLLRIALCGLEGEHVDMPEGWFCRKWKAARGYSMRPDAGSLERIWFSPYCLRDDFEPIAANIERLGRGA